jgi:Phage integrase family
MAFSLVRLATRFDGASSTGVRDAADPPKGASPEMQAWSASRLRTFSESVQSHRWAGVWALIATTGMRRGEALGLRWSDVDLDAKTIQIRSTRIRYGTTIATSTPTSWVEPDINLGRIASNGVADREVGKPVTCDPHLDHESGLVQGDNDGRPVVVDGIPRRSETVKVSCRPINDVVGDQRTTTGEGKSFALRKREHDLGDSPLDFRPRHELDAPLSIRPMPHGPPAAAKV